MKKKLTNTQKYIIAAIIIAIIILSIIWYRNVQKRKAAELAKSKLIPGGTTTTPVITSNIGKTALVKSTSTKFYKVGSFDLAYTKTVVGEFAGSITGDATDSGNTSFYKVVNTNGESLYVLKSQVTVK